MSLKGLAHVKWMKENVDPRIIPTMCQHVLIQKNKQTSIQQRKKIDLMYILITLTDP